MGGQAVASGMGQSFHHYQMSCASLRHTSRATALADVLDGAVDRPELQRIASRVPQGAALGNAFARLLPEGLPPLVKGQPLRTRTDAHGAYFLPVPPHTPGFVSCAARAIWLWPRLCGDGRSGKP